MNVLVIFGTTEGQTRKIAEFIADQIRALGHTTTLVDAADAATAELKLHDFDAVALAASLHLGKFQTTMENFARARAQTLNGMRTAFFPVSLSAASLDKDDIQGLRVCLEEFKATTGWKPGETHNVAGAFRFTKYDFFKRWGMKLIARQKGITADTSKDFELTDWVGLRNAVDLFIATVVEARQHVEQESRRLAPQPSAAKP